MHFTIDTEKKTITLLDEVNINKLLLALKDLDITEYSIVPKIEYISTPIESIPTPYVPNLPSYPTFPTYPLDNVWYITNGWV